MHCPVAVVVWIFDGHETDGGSPSATCTVKLHVLVPIALVAVAVTVVVPRGNALPDAWE